MAIFCYNESTNGLTVVSHGCPYEICLINESMSVVRGAPHWGKHANVHLMVGRNWQRLWPLPTSARSNKKELLGRPFLPGRPQHRLSHTSLGSYMVIHGHTHRKLLENHSNSGKHWCSSKVSQVIASSVNHLLSALPRLRIHTLLDQESSNPGKGCAGRCGAVQVALGHFAAKMFREIQNNIWLCISEP